MGVFLVRLYVGARSSIVNTTIHRANLVDHHKNLAQCFLNGPRTTPTSGCDEEISRRNLDGRLAVFNNNGTAREDKTYFVIVRAMCGECSWFSLPDACFSTELLIRPHCEQRLHLVPIECRGFGASRNKAPPSDHYEYRRFQSVLLFSFPPLRGLVPTGSTICYFS